MIKKYLYFIFLFLGLGIPAAFSTTFMNRPLNDVIKDAPIIVRGTAGLESTSWDKNHRQVYTYTDFNISEVLKGDLNEARIRLRQPGGALDGMEMVVPGVAHFTSGEEAVVLLSPKNPEDESYDVPGFTTGKYNVKTQDNGEVLLVNSLGGGAVYDPGKGPHVLSYNSTIPLDEFRKLANGEKKVTTKQFEASDRPPTKEAEASEHPRLSQVKITPNQPNVAVGLPQEVVNVDSKRGLGTSASLMAVILLTVLGFWGLLRRRSK